MWPPCLLHHVLPCSPPLLTADPEPLFALARQASHSASQTAVKSKVSFIATKAAEVRAGWAGVEPMLLRSAHPGEGKEDGEPRKH